MPNKMQNFLAILIICSIVPSCSKSSEKNEGKAVFQGEYQITNDNLLVTLSVKNNSDKDLKFNTFYRGRFEPLTISSGGSVIAKQGGWDLIKVKPDKLNINAELQPKQSKVFKELCINNDTPITEELKLTAIFSYRDENSWHKENISISKQIEPQKPNKENKMLGSDGK